MYNFNRFHTASSLPENEEKKKKKKFKIINKYVSANLYNKKSHVWAKMCVDQNVYAYIYSLIQK